MADALRITPATEADGEALAALNRAFNEVEISGPAQAARLRETAAHERAFLAWVGDVAVGFTSLRFVPLVTTALPYGEVTELYVQPAFRRRGIARALLAAAEARARALGAPGVILFTGLKNTDAQAFYRAAGYHDYAVTMRRVFGD